ATECPFVGARLLKILQGEILNVRHYLNFLVKASSVAALVYLLVNYSAWATHAQEHDAYVAKQIAEAERALNRGPFPVDGTYTGSAQGFGGLVTMSVDIVDGYIDNVVIVDAQNEDAAWLEMAYVLPERIVEEQTTSIDVVSGATYTSSGILNGTTEALRIASQANG
ncbi:MAG: FMN-binding protein, partial [Eggerthellaceae bacterium]|nr:FMN-binding protein [Eggerthellaceae bacterium]